jgi:uncharacterized protein YkwD
MPIVVACTKTEPRPTQQRSRNSPQRVERQLFDALNDVRSRHGLQPLAWRDEAADVARSHSRAMYDRGFFAHVDPKRGDLTERLKQAGIEWGAIAENIYMQQGHEDPIRRAVKGWMNSPGHRRNILSDRYTQTGIGVFTSPNGTDYYTQVFLSPR